MENIYKKTRKIGKVTLILDYYSGEDSYSDGDIENELYSYIKEYGSLAENVLQEDLRWPTIYHLSKIRENVLNWYTFNKDATILEIGAGLGAITGLLCEKVSSVTVCELSLRRAEILATRHRDKDNLKIFVGNLKDIPISEKFDYVSLIGVLEYAPSFFDAKDSYGQMLGIVRSLLKKDGTLLLAIENKNGLKYWCGSNEDHTGSAYEGINSYPNTSSRVGTFCKQELKALLERNGFTYNNFYYALPDYKLPSYIFSDRYLPTFDSLRKYTPFYYDENSRMLNADEKNALKDIVSNNAFPYFANSYIVEASCSQEYCDVQAVFFNNNRKPNTRTMTIIKDTTIEKHSLCQEGKAHIAQTAKNSAVLQGKGIDCVNEVFDGEKIIAERVCFPTLEQTLLNNSNNYDVMLDMLTAVKKLFVDIIEKNEIKITDLDFSNIFYENGRFIIFDQEWLNENTTASIVMYRALFNFFTVNAEYFSHISIEEVLAKLNLTEEDKKGAQLLEEYMATTVIDQTRLEILKKLSEKWVVDIKSKNVELEASAQERNEFISRILADNEKNIKSANNFIEDRNNYAIENRRLRLSNEIQSLVLNSKNPSRVLNSLPDKGAQLRKLNTFSEGELNGIKQNILNSKYL